MKLLEAIPGLVLGAVLLLAYASCLSGCAGPASDGLAVLHFDRGALGIPEMTLFSLWF